MVGTATAAPGDSMRHVKSYNSFKDRGKNPLSVSNPDPSLEGSCPAAQRAVVCFQTAAPGTRNFLLVIFSSALLLSSLEMSDTKVYEP